MYDLQKKFWEKESLKNRRNPNHQVVKAFVKPKIEEITKFIKPDKKKKILDVGCGNGFFTKYFEEIYTTKGIDFSEKMISLNPVKNCEVQDINDLNEKDNYYDIVFCSNLLHHLDNPKKAISEMKRVSKKYIILSEPNRNNPLMFLFSLLKKEERKALKFSLRYLKNLCRLQGLKIIHTKTSGSIVPNKTPKFLLPFLKIFDNLPFIGFFNLIITKKE